MGSTTLNIVEFRILNACSHLPACMMLNGFEQSLIPTKLYSTMLDIRLYINKHGKKNLIATIICTRLKPGSKLALCKWHTELFVMGTEQMQQENTLLTKDRLHLIEASLLFS